MGNLSETFVKSRSSPFSYYSPRCPLMSSGRKMPNRGCIEDLCCLPTWTSSCILNYVCADSVCRSIWRYTPNSSIRSGTSHMIPLPRTSSASNSESTLWATPHNEIRDPTICLRSEASQRISSCLRKIPCYSKS